MYVLLSTCIFQCCDPAQMELFVKRFFTLYHIVNHRALFSLSPSFAAGILGESEKEKGRKILKNGKGNCMSFPYHPSPESNLPTPAKMCVYYLVLD